MHRSLRSRLARPAVRWAVLVVAYFFSVTASAPLGAQATTSSTHVSDAAADPVAAAARRAASVAVAVGDRVRVRVWREPALSDSLTVDDRGEVALPRLGVLRVTGYSIASLQDTLRARYAEYLRDPSITVTVYRRIGVQGEVRSPGLYYVDATITLREVLAQAGGVTEAGSQDDVRIVRAGRETRLGRWRAGGPLAAELRSGDQVLVGRRSWLSRNALAATTTLALLVSVALQVINASQ
jgi:polysaccharide export outer membrane protein